MPSRLRAAAFSVTVAFVACGAPSSFDNISGGAPPDAGSDARREGGPPIADQGLKPPRPVAPISVSWVNTLRPRFRWELQDIGGARLELCRTRACDGETKTFDAPAADSELVLPEDLATGLWYWRLFGKTSSAVGDTASPVWEVFVRPPPTAGSAENASANGSIVDFNGDGKPDLATVVEYEFQGGSDREITIFLATGDDGITYAPAFDSREAGFVLYGSDTSMGAIDTNGDGFSDLVFPSLTDPTGTTQSEIFVLTGSATAAVKLSTDPIRTAPIPESPNLREAGDLDGDGWGDVAFTTKSSAYLLFGSSAGLGPSTALFDYGPVPDGGAFDAGASDGGIAPPPIAPLALAGSFGRNADAFSDLALGDLEGMVPLDLLLGAARGSLANADLPLGQPPAAVARATALASGDFDGDNQIDLAFMTQSSGKPAVCIAAQGAPGSRILCLPVTSSADAVVSLIACDVDGDGRDELLMSSGPGVSIVRLGADALTTTPLATPFGTRLTLISPGRPGPALWAAAMADGSAIEIFKGTDPAGQIKPPVGSRRFALPLR
jgi:hypothetical protein